MKHLHKTLAVIIGRAGSKGLPGKNTLVIAGRPMIEFSIEDALNSRTVDQTIVSTDSQAIADTARRMRVRVIDRPQLLASDTATVDSAVRHAVETNATPHEIIVILYANVPVRPDDLIDRAVDLLVSSGADSVQSYSTVGKHHPYWMIRMDAEGRVAPYVANTVYRRQDLPPLLLPDGGVIAVTRNSLFTVDPAQPHAFLGTDRRGILSQDGSVVDIDGPADLALAETILVHQASRPCVDSVTC
ncbi:MAG TPA: acylneuraminate cytidylyltransferase family protein [Phycisphaerales bacterium]|nr:acylneuraminate cytidylyltransferase family protein [Phycisphaerales bacterium]